MNWTETLADELLCAARHIESLKALVVQYDPDATFRVVPSINRGEWWIYAYVTAELEGDEALHHALSEATTDIVSEYGVGLLLSLRSRAELIAYEQAAQAAFEQAQRSPTPTSAASA